MKSFRGTVAFGALILAAGCEVQPSDPETTPILTITEIKRGGVASIVYTTDRDQTPTRTTCADGSLPPEVAGRFDGPEAWNSYYVLEPDQSEIDFLMSVRSDSGVSAWIMDVGEGFDVTNPATPPLADGRTVFGYSLGSTFFSTTVRGLSLALSDGAPPDTRASILTILSTGGGRDLDPGDGRFTLIAGC